MTQPVERPAGRYGGPLVRPRTAKVLISLLAAAALAVLVYVGLQVTSSPVSSQLLAYQHLDDDRIGVEFTVTMPPGTEATCRIQALNEGRAQVGFVEERIPAQPERRTLHQVEIATQGPAVSAEILGCDAA